MKLYKGFNKDMTCRGYQFEEGKTYTHEGEVKLCKSGFHACENPLDCFAYYNPADSIFREVEMEEIAPEKGDDSKIAGKTIKIGARISFGKMVQIAVDYINSHVDKSKQQQVMDGFRSAASNTGDYSAAEVSGKQSVALAMGRTSKARGAKGCWIVCAEWDKDDIKDVQCARVDGETIQAGVWYTLRGGKFVEV